MTYRNHCRGHKRRTQARVRYAKREAWVRAFVAETMSDPRVVAELQRVSLDSLLYGVGYFDTTILTDVMGANR